jgi:heptosyltransferase-2
MSHIAGLQATIQAPFQHGGLQWQARRSLAARIKSGEWGQFDRAYVLPNSLKSALLPWMAGIKTRLGYKGEQRFGLINHRLANPPRDQRGSMVAHYLALTLTEVVQDKNTKPRLQLRNQTTSNPTTSTLISNTLTVLAPGAEYGPAKRWGEENYAQLAAELLSQPFKTVALLGSAKEAALCQAIRDRACALGADTRRIENLAGKTDLKEAIALIAGAKQMVSNDSGLMHIAAAFGIPQVAIFGSSNPEHTPPLNDKARVLWLGFATTDTAKLACTPCYQRECPKTGPAHLACFKGITTQNVLTGLDGS